MRDIDEIQLPSFPWVWHPQGDANEYCLLTSDNRWVVAFRCNGELMTAKQEAIIRHMVAAANAAEGVSITALETVGKSLFDGDISTLEQENRQMRARMERLEQENAQLQTALAESRGNDMAAMGWLADCRMAVGDNGKRMLPEFVEHLKALKQQRDELLAALERIKGVPEKHPKDPIACANQTHLIAELAVASAKGGAA